MIQRLLLLIWSKQLSGLVVENLTIDHGAIRAINNVSFTVPQGQLAAIIGANGAGKTTLLRALSGLNIAKSGSASWNGKSILQEKPEDLAKKWHHACVGWQICNCRINCQREFSARWIMAKRQSSMSQKLLRKQLNYFRD
jgi:ABC-type branched-subunit amino acid transport system ATPase component